MDRKRIVVALGHRDLGGTLPEQLLKVRESAKMLAELSGRGYALAVVFSNSPQLGLIHTAMKELRRSDPERYCPTPLSVCSAMSQGFIGYDIQNALRAELRRRGSARPVCTILTQTSVDPYDESFYHPGKLVGKRLSREEAEEEEERGNEVRALPDGSFQRLVPSPKPREIIELDAVRALLDAGQIVISAGGGGIPVMPQGAGLRGAAALIEKDLAASLLARELDAELLLFSTGVPELFLHYGTEKEEGLRRLDSADARRLLSAGEFGEGSMGPKVEAAIEFTESGEGKRAIICQRENALKALEGLAGTTILWEKPVEQKAETRGSGREHRQERR